MSLFRNLFKTNTHDSMVSELYNKINDVKDIVVRYGTKIDCKEGVGYSHTLGVGDMSIGQSILLDNNGYLCGMELYGKKNTEKEGQNITIFFNRNSIDFEKIQFSVINTETRQIVFSEKCEIESLKHTVDAHYNALKVLKHND